MTHRPLRVLLDARMLVGRFSGIARMVTSLVDELAQRDDVRVIVLCGNDEHSPWTHRDDVEVAPSSFGRKDRSPSRRLWWEETRLRALIRRSSADVFHATWNSGIPFACPVPSVLTIHDLIPWDKPGEYFALRRDRWAYRAGVQWSARRAAAITTVSAFTRGQLLDRLGVAGDRVLVVSNGVTPPGGGSSSSHDQSDGGARPSLPGGTNAEGSPPPEFVLYVGGHEPRKNVSGLLRAMLEYWRAFDPRLELWLTGRKDALCPAAKEVMQTLPQNAPVRFLDALSESDLVRAYRRAEALMLLSTDEGFGLPIVEAMSHGCPVIAANRAALPEVVGEAGVLVDPDQPAEAARALHRICADQNCRKRLAGLGLLRASRFTWEAAAGAIVEVYRGVVAQSVPLSASRKPHWAGDSAGQVSVAR
ncbi:MAG: glycosyltransferase family 1 protein [Planctomycetota bacterium]